MGSPQTLQLPENPALSPNWASISPDGNNSTIGDTLGSTHHFLAWPEGWTSQIQVLWGC